MHVLISGASVAGPALAYWLHHHGHQVTVVERAPVLRDSGYAVDFRGDAFDVLEQMGILDAAPTAGMGGRSPGRVHRLRSADPAVRDRQSAARP